MGLVFHALQEQEPALQLNPAYRSKRDILACRIECP